MMMKATILPIVEAIMDDKRPKTQEKGKDMAKAREPKSVTCCQKNASKGVKNN